MTDISQETRVKAASEIEIDRKELNNSITEFVGPSSEYYIKVFQKLHDTTSWSPTNFNIFAALLGPLWSASRAVWGMFWTFLILEIIAWVQIGRGAWGNPGADLADRAARQQGRAQDMLDKAAAASEQADIDRFNKLANNLNSMAEKTMEQAAAAQGEAFGILMVGVFLLLALKLIQGFSANSMYERQYSNWRIAPKDTENGRKLKNVFLGVVMVALTGPLVIYKFTVNEALGLLDEFPEDRSSALILGEGKGSLFSAIAAWLEAKIDAAAIAGSDMFDGIVAGIRAVLDALTLALNGSPWPVVMLFIAVIAWRAAGARVAIFTMAAMAYTALLGYWSVAMETVALVGAAVVLCVIFGVPLGLWFGKSKSAYRLAEPVLDLMQTLPAFVYLIPIIALFGTGNPPGILATIIFGMPPVIRLTALGMRGVPESIKEAADAFGATRWQKLKDVEIPLAMPSIMAGVNQTILMCLSMVVIISLIGGGGLGKEILQALQYAAKGPGLLGGFAILFLAMVMDRIVQGAFRTGNHYR